MLLLHLLYKNGKYQQVLKSFSDIKQMTEERGFRVKSDILTLAFGACYKLVCSARKSIFTKCF